jgi:DNA-binding NtrC family response regulator
MADMNKGRVLIIDDEDIVRISCQRILVPEGYEVKTTKSAAEGLGLLAQDAVDVVLTDLKMPDIDGMQVLKKVKEEWPDIEVIMITGYQTINTAVEAIKLGAFDYIENPFTPGAIVEAIDKAISHRQGNKKK